MTPRLYPSMQSSQKLAGAALLRRCMRPLVLLATFTFVQPLAAHRLNITTSDIVWLAQDGALEVTHSVHLDDALALLARLGDNSGALDLKSSARLMSYLNAHFQLVTRETPVALEPYGAHIDSGVLYMYQRAVIKTLPPALEVTNRILHDVVQGPHNQINWRVGDIVRSKITQPDQPVVWLTLQSRSVPHSDQNQRDSNE